MGGRHRPSPRLVMTAGLPCKLHLTEITPFRPNALENGPGSDQRGHLAHIALGQFGHGPLNVRPHEHDRVELVSVWWQLADRQPVPCRDQAHRGADVCVQVVAASSGPLTLNTASRCGIASAQRAEALADPP